MTNNEKLQRIIAVYSGRVYVNILLNRVLKNKYVYEGFKDNLAHDICNAWPGQVDCTELHNTLFTTLKTGQSIFTQYGIDGTRQYK